MELAVAALDLPSATTPTSAEGPDSYYIVQVHDCAGVNPWSTCPLIKKGLEQFMKCNSGPGSGRHLCLAVWSSANSIAIAYQVYYPGLLKYHQFVKVGAAYNLGMKIFNMAVPDALHSRVGFDIGKFKSCNDRMKVGRQLFSTEDDYRRFRLTLPTEYGGSGDPVGQADTLHLEAKTEGHMDLQFTDKDTPEHRPVSPIDAHS